MDNQNLFDVKVANTEFRFEVHAEREELSNIVRRQGLYSKNDLEVLSELVPKGSYVLDIGANIGWHTMFFSKLVGSDGRVFSFEPEPKNAALLRRNVELNALRNVTVVECALADKKDDGTLFASATNFGDHILNLKSSGLSHLAQYGVEVDTVDSYFAAHNLDPRKVSLVKMDIQGSEPKALAGMTQFFSVHKPYLFLEYSPKHIRAVGSSVFDLFSLADRLHYHPYFLNGDFETKPENYLRYLSVLDLFQATQELEQAPGDISIDLLFVPQKPIG